ncbi:MAG: hypothetical protein KKE64_02935, partial [Candidatus Omnitrophica bacterium]|nr:hypothetical protein [Candidatus Omnitrophota bacterium]
LNSANIPLREDLEYLLAKSSGYIPKTTAKIKNILASLCKRKKEGIFTELLSLCDSIHEETNKFCVVVFDEFNNLETLGVKNIYNDWSKLLMLQKNTMYIVLSSFKFKTRCLLSKELSLLFGNFLVLEIDSFDSKTSARYLRASLGEYRMQKYQEDFIIHFTGGFPFYLEVITKALLQSPQVPLVDILEDVLFESSGILNQKFMNFLINFSRVQGGENYVHLLYLISSGQNKIKDIAHQLKITKKELDVRTNYLLGIDALARNGDFLKINDRIFGFWLKFVYREKMHSFTFDAKNQKTLFRKNIESLISDFLESANRPLIDRLRDLFNLFCDDSLQVEKKKLKLSHFREIKRVEFERKGIREGLVCRSQDSLWIVAIKNDLLTESDVIEFSQECKKYRYKLEKKIIVASSDIEDSSLLRALEEKILTWDLNKLNSILDLYSRPRVVA